MDDNYIHHHKGSEAQRRARNLIEGIRKFGADVYGESWRLSSRNIDQTAKMLIAFYEDGKSGR